MANKVKKVKVPSKKGKRKNKKLQYVLTIERLLKTGFHFGDDATSVHKCMTPFIVGKSKIHSRFKIAEKKVIMIRKANISLYMRFDIGKMSGGEPS